MLHMHFSKESLSALSSKISDTGYKRRKQGKVLPFTRVAALGFYMCGMSWGLWCPYRTIVIFPVQNLFGRFSILYNLQSFL